MFAGLRNHFRRVGHRHRAAGRWARAADAYGWHTRLHPDDLHDWIRLAEAAQNAGRPEIAERAYARAWAAAPHDAHIAFQLAQALKRAGRDAQALATFERALQLSERRPVTGDTGCRTTPGPLPAGLVLYSVQDMVSYLGAHATVTGIQRVQAGIARHLLATQGDSVGFVMTDAEPGLAPGDFWLIQPEDLMAVIDAVEGDGTSPSRLKASIARCRERARAIRPGEGHVLVVLGAFWALGNSPVRYLEAKRRGARIGVYLYDLIPVTHPQFCEMELSLHFSVGLGQMCAIADFVMTISEDTAKEVRQLLADHGIDPLPVQSIPLAHALTPAVDEVFAEAGQMPPFVAYVSTIEARKNHIYLVQVWQALIARGVPVPDLVFVGRPGWKVGPLLALLAQTRNLEGRVRLLHDLSDAQLADIYRQARFTVFSSFVEGWGLPIGESLAYGTPCVASGTSSMPEVGGDLVDYIDPTDIEDGVAVIGRLLSEPGLLEARRRRIADRFVPRTWGDVGHDLSNAVRTLSAVAPRSVTPPVLKAGQRFRPGEVREDEDFSLAALMRSPRGLLFAGSFEIRDSHGAWLTAARAEIRFRTDLRAGSPITVTLELHRSASAGTGGLALRLDERQVEMLVMEIPIVGTPPCPLTINGRVGDDGVVAVTLSLSGVDLVSGGTIAVAALVHRPRRAG